MKCKAFRMRSKYIWHHLACRRLPFTHSLAANEIVRTLDFQWNAIYYKEHGHLLLNSYETRLSRVEWRIGTATQWHYTHVLKIHINNAQMWRTRAPIHSIMRLATRYNSLSFSRCIYFTIDFIFQSNASNGQQDSRNHMVKYLFFFDCFRPLS